MGGTGIVVRDGGGQAGGGTGSGNKWGTWDESLFGAAVLRVFDCKSLQNSSNSSAALMGLKSCTQMQQ